MPPARRTPIGFGNAAWRDPLWSAGVGDTSSDVNEINSALHQAGLPPNEVQSAVQAYTGLDEASTTCILGILDGGPVTLTALAPLIGAGLLATGVGAPIAAAITALLPILDGIIGMFSGPQETCTWKVGYYCFNRTQPYGPTDPRWETWTQFAGARLDAVAVHNWETWNGSQLSGVNVSGQQHWIIDPKTPANGPPFGTHPASVLNASSEVVHTDALGALSGYITTLGSELIDLDANVGQLPPERAFMRAYYHAWQVATEYAINGYKSPDYYALLTACAESWNRGHEPRTTFTFQPQNVGIPSSYDPNVSYIGLLLNGSVNSSADQMTPRDHAPVTINTGPRIIQLNIGAIRKQNAAIAKASAPTSTATKIAVGSAIVAGGAAIGVGIWAFATHQAYGAAWERVLSGAKRAVKKPFKKA